MAIAGLLILAACNRGQPSAATPSPVPTGTAAPAPATPAPTKPAPAPQASPTTTPALPAPSTPTPTAIPATPTPAHSPTPIAPSGKSPFPPLQPDFIVHGDQASNRIALTFDMGLTSAGTAAELLGLLRRHDIKATFFLTGEWAEANPDLTRQIVADGHELGNHSFDHPDFTGLSPDQMRQQIDRTYALLRQLGVAGSLKPYFRAPFGATNQTVLDVVASEGYHIIHWTLDSGDWLTDSTAQSVAEKVESAKAGDIIVAHGYVAKTLEGFRAAIPSLQDKGYRLGPLSALLP